MGASRRLARAGRQVALGATVALLAAAGGAAATRLNGFDLSEASVPLDLIEKGGPPRDGIPSIDDPSFVSAEYASRWLDPGDRVMGVALHGEARAYPIAILNWHEIVNDEIGGEAVVVTWCPLCGSGVVFRAPTRRVEAPLRFGVSGLLYNSDVLLYDRQTESLWSQLAHEAIAGPLKGTELRLLAFDMTTFEDWRARHPDARVLSRDTGYHRPYERDPYAGYERRRELMFPVGRESNRLHPKAEVLGIELDGVVRAYPFRSLERIEGSVEDTLAGRTVRVHFDGEHERAWITGADGKRLPTVVSFWFAWYAFHPQTEVWSPG